jgi:hypothetical protein
VGGVASPALDRYLKDDVKVFLLPPKLALWIKCSVYVTVGYIGALMSGHCRVGLISLGLVLAAI